MSLKSELGHVLFSVNQRSVAELISERLCWSALALEATLELEIRGITRAAITPKIVTMARSSSSEKPRRGRYEGDFVWDIRCSTNLAPMKQSINALLKYRPQIACRVLT